MASPAILFSMCKRNTSCGVTARSRASAVSTRKFRSGMAAYRDSRGTLLQIGEETANLNPGGVSSRKAAPVPAHQTSEFVTLIDRRQVIVARGCDAVNQ